MKVILFLALFLGSFRLVLGFENSNNTKDSILAVTLQKDGKAAANMGDYKLALEKFTKLYQLREKMYGSKSIKLAPPLTNIGITYKNLGNLDKAIEVYKAVESICINASDPNNATLGIAYSNIGNIYRLTGDYAQALEYQKNAYRILKRDSLRSLGNLLVCKLNIAEINLKLGYANVAVKMGEAGLKNISKDLKPNLYDLLAQAYLNLGEIKLSEKNYLLAIDAWIKLLGENNVELISEYLAYSSMLLSQKQFEKAHSYIEKANNIVLRFFREKSTQHSDVLLCFGDYYFNRSYESDRIDDFRQKRKESLNSSLKYYQEAIVALVDSFQTKDIFINPPIRNVISEIQLVEVIKKKALTFEKLGEIFETEFEKEKSIKHYQASLNTYSLAIELIRRLQIGFENEDSKMFIAQNQQQTFSEAIGAAYKLYRLTKDWNYAAKAFEFSEKSKSSNLLASIKDVKAKEFGGIPDNLLTQEKELKSFIFNYKSKLLEETSKDLPDTQKINLYSSEIFKYNEEYARLIDSFEKSYPKYYALKYENKVAQLKQVQSRLNGRQALVEYFLKGRDNEQSPGELYIFSITRESIDLIKQNVDEIFFSEIQKFHDFLINSNILDTKKKDYVSFSSSAFNLYQKLLKPVEDKIDGKSLIIIPHEKLSYIPFDALISEKPDTTRMNFKDLRYVIRDYSVNYGYSATLLFDSNTDKLGSDELIAFSPEYNVLDRRKDVETGKSYSFSPLPGAKQEIESISHFVSSVSLVGKNAQETEFKKKVENFDILHLAMHTIINDSLPMLSKLVFSRPDGNSSEDGFLNAYEIYNMKINSRLAVLSACETGYGKLQGGEGVMSMARGFIYAGCPSVVMTLWKVEDKSGASIMSDFYRYLSKGKSKDVALRMAKLNHLEKSDPLTAHPHFWLGYISIGSPDPLFRSKDIYFVIILLAVIAIVFADYHLRKRRRKNRQEQ